MASFLSDKQVDALRDELKRLTRSDDPDQVQALQAMCGALDRDDKTAFEVAWDLLEGHVRFGGCGESLPPPPEPVVKPTNVSVYVKELDDRLAAIERSRTPDAPKLDSAATGVRTP